MDKRVLIERVVSQLGSDLATMEKAAQASHDAATHASAESDGKYDTRGIEASYLAGAQKVRALQLRRGLAVLQAMEIHDFGTEDAIRPSALVELECDGIPQHVLLALYGGGVRIAVDQLTVQVVTPASPLGQKLIGREVGDDFELKLPSGVRVYEIVDVC